MLVSIISCRDGFDFMNVSVAYSDGSASSSTEFMKVFVVEVGSEEHIVVVITAWWYSLTGYGAKTMTVCIITRTGYFYTTFDLMHMSLSRTLAIIIISIILQNDSLLSSKISNYQSGKWIIYFLNLLDSHVNNNSSFIIWTILN